MQPPIATLGHAVLARAVFDLAGTTFWLMDPAIKVCERVGRPYTDR
jgi:hypothetical protein